MRAVIPVYIYTLYFKCILLYYILVYIYIYSMMGVEYVGGEGVPDIYILHIIYILKTNL